MTKILSLGIYLTLCVGIAPLYSQDKHYYIANDNHTDYFWSGTAEEYEGVAIREIDYYLDLADSTDNLESPYQSRYNLDGAWYAYEYQKNKTPEEFERLLDRIRSGHISLPFNYFVSTYGGQPTEAVLRGMYWPAKLARSNNLEVELASNIESQTLPLGLASLWAGSGVKYSWKGVCGCSSPVTREKLQDRNNEIYWYRGLDNSEVLMKWYSLSLAGNFNLGGYAEARFPVAAIEVGAEKCETPNYPYNIIGAFGYGWDDLETQTDIFVQTAQQQSNANQQVYVSNESDFFEHFLNAYDPGNLPSETLTFGNDWDVDCASMASNTSKLRYSVEKLRTAESMASLAAMIDPTFYQSENALRDEAWRALGSYWEHDFGGGGIGAVIQRGNWQIELQQAISNYVDQLYEASLNALASNIILPPGKTRFVVFNGLGWTRNDYADIAYNGNTDIKIVEVASGTEVPFEVINNNGTQYLRILASGIPAVGYKVYEIQPGPASSFPNTATLEDNVFENSFFRLTLTSEGVITSLIDKQNGNREYVSETQGRYLNDFGQGLGDGGNLSLVHNGPISAKVACASANPLQHTTYITLYRDINRVDIANTISDEFGDDIRTYSFPFTIETPTVWHEELGAIIKAKYTTNGGHYATVDQPVRYEWQTLNHFVDVGNDTEGITLSSKGASFMKLGNFSAEFLDANSAYIQVLIGGRMAESGPGFANQFDQTEFKNDFSLLPRSEPFNTPDAMQFALEHQNPLTGKLLFDDGTALPEAGFSLVQISSPEVLLWALKPSDDGIAEGGLIARVWNLDTMDQATVFDFSPAVLSTYKTTHLETNIAPLTTVEDNLVSNIGQQRMETFRVFLDSIIADCSVQSSISATICEGEDLEGYTESGIYTDILTTAEGCDSIRILELTIFPLNTTLIEEMTCDSLQVGEEIEIFTGQDGCDSTVITSLVFVSLEINLEVQAATGGEQNGSASVSPAGGQGPYTVVWSTGDTGLEIIDLAPGDYSVTITDANGCEVSTSFEVLMVTQVSDIPTLTSFELFPNPTSQQVFIHLKFDQSQEGVIYFQDYAGKIVFRENLQGNSFNATTDVRELPAGLYQVWLIIDDKIAVKKLVVE